MEFLYIGIGGFLGANARYIISNWLTENLSTWLGWNVPFGTAFVNITGSLLLALFMVWSGVRLDLPSNLRLLIGTGFFGAYTTFSTYANESVDLWHRDWRVAVGYIVMTNALCLIGVLFGLFIGNRLWQLN